MSPPALHHVLMTADTIGGVWTFALDLCRELDAAEIAVTLVTMGRQPDAAQRAQVARLRKLSLLSRDYRLEWMDACERDVAASQDFVLGLVHDLRPDLVHANSYSHAALAFGVPVLLTAHSCVATWWLACSTTELPDRYRAYMGWISDAVSRADLLAAPSRAFLVEFERVHGRARAQRVIRNGRSLPPVQETDKRPVVLSAGRLWDEAKNIDVLCRAAHGSDLHIEVAGDTVSPDGRPTRLGNVLWLGRLEPDALIQRMAAAAVFAAPSRYEPFGLSILEAALCRCALVLADIPSLRELWDGAAIFVPADDPAAWRHALSGVIDDPARRARAGLCAEAHARRYSRQAMGSAYLDAYGALVAEGRLSGVAA